MDERDFRYFNVAFSCTPILLHPSSEEESTLPKGSVIRLPHFRQSHLARIKMEDRVVTERSLMVGNTDFPHSFL